MTEWEMHLSCFHNLREVRLFVSVARVLDQPAENPFEMKAMIKSAPTLMIMHTNGFEPLAAPLLLKPVGGMAQL